MVCELAENADTAGCADVGVLTPSAAKPAVVRLEAREGIAEAVG